MKKLVFLFLAAACSLQLAGQGQGFATEQDELAFATKLDMEKIWTAVGE